MIASDGCVAGILFIRLNVPSLSSIVSHFALAVKCFWTT